MAKNAYLKSIQEAIDKKLAERSLFTLQMASDAAVLAANDIFGAGEERAAKFHKAMTDYFFKICKMTTEDSKDIEYTKVKLDEALERVLGKNFEPWDVRYEVCKAIGEKK